MPAHFSRSMISQATTGSSILNKLLAGLGGPSHALNLQIALAIPRYIMKHHESPCVYENAYRPYFTLGRSEQTDAKLMGASAS